MRYTSIFLIALIGCSIASQYSSPADALLNKVDRLVSGARNEQAAQTRIYVVQAQRCKVEQGFRRSEMADATVAAGAASQQLGLCRAEQPVARQAHRQSRSELKSTRQQLVALEVEYQVFQKVHLLRQQEHMFALASVQQAYNILGNFVNGKNALNGKAVFAEVSKQINSVFKVAVKHQFHSEMIPVMSALVELTASPATTVSTAALQKVVNLLRKLEAGIKASENRRAAQWAEFQGAYTASRGLLKQQVRLLVAIVRKYRVYRAKLRFCVRSESRILSLARAKLTRNTQVLNATVMMCNAYDAKYKLQTQQRQEYVVLLTKLRSYVVSAISNFDHGLYSRGDFVNTL